MRDLLLQLFNMCLKTGTYVWNKSVITPIHKKGSTTNPDNYRAIAVCSCIGKLLSTMLLNRLIVHRDTTCPDPPNQAGAKICRGFESQKSRCRDKPKCQKSRHCRGKNRKNRGDVAAKIVKIATNILIIAALSRRKRRLQGCCRSKNYFQR